MPLTVKFGLLRSVRYRQRDLLYKGVRSKLHVRDVAKILDRATGAVCKVNTLAEISRSGSSLSF